MGTRVAFQMDAPARINPAGDSTLALIEEAANRGMACYHYEPHQLQWCEGVLRAPLAPITVDMSHPNGMVLGEATMTPLSEMDVIWVRQEPPYDMGYLTSTWLLDSLPEKVRVVNRPSGLRNLPEKLSSLHHAGFMPPTLISRDDDAVHAFTAHHGDIIAKPLYGFGGHSVFRFKKGDGNLDTFLEHIRQQDHLPWMWQAFLPDVSQGERRIILVNGEVAGIFGRIPEDGSIRSNMRVGGTPVAAEITPRQQEICATVGPMLKNEGIVFCGLDVIGDTLIEMNITCPTGLRAIETLYGRSVASDIWDATLK